MLTLIIGPMFSGKTTELNRQVKRHIRAKKNVLMIKYSKDSRYSKDKIMTHDNVQIETETILMSNLHDSTILLNLPKLKHSRLDNYDVIAIDEGQFLDNIDNFTHKHALTKIVLVAALNSDFNQNPFLNVSKLVSKCDNIIKLTAVCDCNKDATFSKLIKKEKNNIENDENDENYKIERIGGAELYNPVCRICYFH